jgi:hypothetical protein
MFPRETGFDFTVPQQTTLNGVNVLRATANNGRLICPQDSRRSFFVRYRLQSIVKLMCSCREGIQIDVTAGAGSGQSTVPIGRLGRHDRNGRRINVRQPRARRAARFGQRRRKAAGDRRQGRARHAGAWGKRQHHLVAEVLCLLVAEPARMAALLLDLPHPILAENCRCRLAHQVFVEPLQPMPPKRARSDR